MADPPPPAAQHRRLVVEVHHALDLPPKDGEGSCSAFVELEVEGQRRRTKTCPKQVNPTWNETFDFTLPSPHSLLQDPVHFSVFHDNNRRPHFLGRLSISPSAAGASSSSTPLLLLPLRRRGLFSSVRGSLALKIYYHDDFATVQPPPAEPPPPPLEPPAPPPNDPIAAAAAAPPDQLPAPLPPAATVPTTTAANVSESQYHHVPLPPAHPITSLPPLIHNHAVLDPFPVRKTTPSIGHRAATYDLVERMYYLFVRVVKARNLPPRDLLAAAARPFVSLHVGAHTARTRTAAAVHPQQPPEWREVFAFSGWESLREGGKLEASVWEEHDMDPHHRDYVGGVVFDLKEEIPRRLPPDSPLAPQWYRLEAVRGGGRPGGELMLAVWVGTQSDEAFADAWQSDNAGNIPHTRAKVYLSPKLWYLRVTVIEAQDLRSNHLRRHPDAVVCLRLGFQQLRTRPSRSRPSSANPFWGDDLIFVAAEPFHERHLSISVLDRIAAGRDEEIGHAVAPLSDVERRFDARPLASKWFNLISAPGNTSGAATYKGRLHLRLCFDGGYHVMDETAQLSSDFRPSARQLWRPPIGVLELGIIRAQGLLPMKTRAGRGATDAYCVAKYGPKWVRTRTIVDTFGPRWNEQYMWDVYDACTVLTVGVFDNVAAAPTDPPAAPPPATGGGKPRDTCIGKVRIRISNLQRERIYTHSYPLIALHPTGAKKMGEVELAIRFSAASMVHLVTSYALPLFPAMHHLLPFNRITQDNLRHAATELIILQMVKAEPPLRAEVVRYMLDTQAARWSVRRSKANWKRITTAMQGIRAAMRWTEDICRWRNPTTTMLVHMLFFILVCYPELILPTLFLYMFLIGAWHYRFRPRSPPHMDVRLSCADVARRDELDEEFDPIPSNRPAEVVRQRYDHLRHVAYYIQVALADVAGLGERLLALLSWRDPIATSIFVGFCLMVAVVLYVVPLQIIILLLGLYFLRHPRFRRRRPPLLLNFFRRLPTLADRVL